MIAVVSPKGGVGKTTVSVNLAAALATLGKKVLIIDTNLETPHVAIYCGFVGFKYSIEDALNGMVSIKNTIYKTDEPNMHIMPSRVFKQRGDGNAKYKIINMFYHLEKLAEAYDFIVMDSKPSTDMEFIKLIKGVHIIVVAAPEITSLIEARKLEKEGIKSSLNVDGLVLNRVNTKIKSMMNDSEIGKMVSFRNVWKIPEDRGILDALHRGIPMVLYDKNSPSSRAFIKFAKDVITGL